MPGNAGAPEGDPRRLFNESMTDPGEAMRFLLSALQGIASPDVLASMGRSQNAGRHMADYTRSGSNESPLVWFSRLLGLR